MEGTAWVEDLVRSAAEMGNHPKPGTGGDRCNSPRARKRQLGHRVDLLVDRNPIVEVWVKNDHLGFEVLYMFKGVAHKYRPDFLIRLTSGTMLILEVKGQDTEKDKTKRKFLDEWVQAVNNKGGFGTWTWAVSFTPSDIGEILAEYAGHPGSTKSPNKAVA